MLKIVIVEENGEIAGMISELLKVNGLIGYIVADNHQAYNSFIANQIDVIFLKDVRLEIPVCLVIKKIRKINKNVPIVVMGNPVDASDLILILSLGADNYISHFRPLELLAYLSALIRFRFPAERNRSTYVLDDRTSLNVASQKIQIYDKCFQLSWQECLLLKHLVDNKETIVSSEELILDCWIEVNADTKTYLSKAIMRIRGILLHDPKLFIETIRGRGYMLIAISDI